ncbi:MAG: TIGR03617 family F420-dependent LLM class oxidoreductase [Chloroflexi bacterium]|nr:TIGR03617 family F420-dependent LLM class oxidoreductase [Chloroflexota bacterium]
MKVETALVAGSFEGYSEQAKKLEAAGYDSVITPEAGHDPFLPLMTIAEHTDTLRFGTGVAIAFPRSPYVTAQLAWDLQRFSGGRFMLGLGTQVKGHNERRYSTAWPSPPGPRLREYLLCLKAIFNTFQNNERPSYEGDHYRFTLISPFFNPGPNTEGHIPLYISAVNKYNCRLVGELCDGIRMHPFNTPKYTQEVIIPSIKAGAEKAGRNFDDIDLVGGGFVITGDTQEDVEKAKGAVRQQLSFYASTRVYHPVLAVHGWEEVGQELFRYSMEGKWTEMAQGITDEMLEEFAVIGTYDEIIPKIEDRFAGVLTTLDFNFGPGGVTDPDRLAQMVGELKAL